jgi:NAD-dependent deacetylase
MENRILKLTEILNESENIVFFGGAGVSTASNIPDFRSSTGIFSKKLNRNISPEQAVSHSFLIQHPDEFYDFYKKNLIYPDAKPNDCHYALAK